MGAAGRPRTQTGLRRGRAASNPRGRGVRPRHLRTSRVYLTEHQAAGRLCALSSAHQHLDGQNMRKAEHHPNASTFQVRRGKALEETKAHRQFNSKSHPAGRDKKRCQKFQEQAASRAAARFTWAQEAGRKRQKEQRKFKGEESNTAPRS
ncbi:uncharacterized protein C22orf31 homolog isoform X4 [Fukomys damarensis]|uniref:uncharacterized protein C22orf31 homolog isoform X4 n=1 Tax=Fukomys damarensis TaxID=885580 RepID=UPI0014553DEF|nr:uncharacterized protein C22orf31 homolog isoform X4 [Fukomys damarensis]